MAEAKTTAVAQKAATTAAAAPKKSTTAKPAAAKAAAKPAEKKAPAKKAAAPKKAAAKKTSLSPEERYRWIQTRAYFIAESDGFKGDSQSYWAQAEIQIAAVLK